MKAIAPSILSRVVKDVHDSVDGFTAISKSNYFLKRIHVHESKKGTAQLSLGFIYLQDYSNYRESLDEEVMSAIRDSLREQSLDSVVTDVVVNLLHVHNGKREDG